MARTRWGVIAGTVLALSATATVATATSSPAGSSTAPQPVATGPVHAGDFPDPSVLVVGGRYYAYSTQSDGRNIQVMMSTDLLDWTMPRDALPELPIWAVAGYTWAPSVAADPTGGYEMFFAARDRELGLQCIGLARSPSPLGPFHDTSTRPFLCQTALGGSIDPAVFADDHTDYLLWKSDGANGTPQQLWSQPLDATDSAVVGTPSLLLSATSNWENGVVEGPAMLRTAGGLFLYFSGSRWSTSDYSIGVVGCDTPVGPCVDAPTTQVVSTASHLSGPGGPAFFVAVSGRVMMAYAAWSGGPGTPAGRRSLYIDSVDTTGTSPTLIEMLVRTRERAP